MTGRPTKYSDTYVKKTKDYVDSCNDELVQIVSGESEKFTAFKDLSKITQGHNLRMGEKIQTIFRRY